MRLPVFALLRRSLALPLSFAAALIFLFGFPASAQRPSRITLVTNSSDALVSASDLGPIPGAQRLSLTFTLAPPSARAAALDQFLASLITPGSPSFHRWITPAEFAASYGATADQLSAATAWAQSQGLTVDAISPANTRLTLSGSASQVQSALEVCLHLFSSKGHTFFSNTSDPTLPAEIFPLVTSIEGLSTLSSGPAGAPATLLNVQPSSLDIATLGTLVDSNTTPILSLDARAATGSLAPSEIAAYTALFHQAAAQGITTLFAPNPASASIPGDLTDVTVVAAPGDALETPAPIAPRPSWQAAPGLPADSLRHVPDLTVASLPAFTEALSAILRHAGRRQGNVAPILYALSPTPGLFTQEDIAAPGTWEAMTGLGLIDLVTFAKAFPRGTGAATVSVSSSDPSPTHGENITLSATVASGTGGAAPSGTVVFSSSNPAFTSVSVAVAPSGVATTANLLLPGDSYPITATYSGDATYASASATTNFTVQPEPGNFSLTASSPVNLGNPITVVATVASASGFGTPTGTITVTPNGLPGQGAQSLALTGSGGSATASFNFPASQAGSVSFQASCTPSDTSFTCYTPQTAPATVYPGTPTVLLSLSTSSPTVGQPITFTVAVNGVSGTAPTGRVDIVDNVSGIASITLPATTASAPLTLYPTHTVKAVYNGDSNYIPAESQSHPVAVGLAPSTTSVSPAASVITFGQTANLTINVASASGNNVAGTPPTGTVLVTVGSAAAISATLSGGAVNVPLNGLAVGSYPIVIAYQGDTNYAASSAPSATVTVTQTVGVIAGMVSPTSFTTGSTATLTVQLALPGNAQVPANSGFTAVLNGVTYNGSFNINPGGNTATGAVTLYAPLAGSYNIAIACAASAAFTCNTTSVPITSTATVAGTPPGGGTTPSQTALSASSTAPAPGQAITLTATVTASAAAIAANAPTGTVSFFNGSTLLMTAPLALVNGSFVASVSVTLSGTQTHNLTAVYSGDTVYAGSTSAAISIGSIAAPAAIALTTSTLNGVAGYAITFTASVTGSTTSGQIPTGSVAFYLAGSPNSLLGTVGLSLTGAGASIASFTTTGIPAGPQNVFAVYSGDRNFGSMTSNIVPVGLGDYVAAFSPQTLSLTAGQSGQSTLTLNTINNYGGTVNFSCTVPSGSLMTCSLSPAQLTGSGSVVLSVSTAARKAFAAPFAPFGSSGRRQTSYAAGLTLAAFASLLLGGSRRRQRVPSLLLLCLALSLITGLGCTASTFYNNAPGSPAGGTPLGTSILTINTVGVDGTTVVRHNYSFQVTVQ